MKQSKYIYQSGDKHNDLMLTGKSYKKSGITYLEFICKCGKVKWANMYKIFSGKTASCGCRLNVKNSPYFNFTYHGMSRHPLYKHFHNVISRCYNQKSDSFKDYGLRGITICEEWLKDVTVFIKWAINNGWEKGLELERVNNNKGYSPENCIWATRKVQSRNKRTTHLITAFGETKCFRDWQKDERCKISHGALFNRLVVLKWDAEKAISTASIR